MKKKGKIALLAAVVLGIGMSVSYAHIVPGWDEPYDPPNYYSPTNISIPDSAPSPFALRELMRGDVYTTRATSRASCLATIMPISIRISSRSS